LKEGNDHYAGNHREPGQQAQCAYRQHELIAPAQPVQLRIRAVRFVVKGKCEEPAVTFIPAQYDAVAGVHGDRRCRVDFRATAVYVQKCAVRMFALASRKSNALDGASDDFRGGNPQRGSAGAFRRKTLRCGGRTGPADESSTAQTHPP